APGVQKSDAAGHRVPCRQAVCCCRRAAGRSASGLLDRERGSAAAGGGCVRVANHELRAFEVFLVVDLGTREILQAHRVDQQLHAVLVQRGVIVVDDFVEREAVLETRTAAALHEYAQLELVIGFFIDQFLDLGGCGIGEDDGDGGGV